MLRNTFSINIKSEITLYFSTARIKLSSKNKVLLENHLKHKNMKKALLIIVILLEFAGFAQENKEKKHRDQIDKFTPAQKNQLLLKKMTLELDLNASQQKEMSSIISEQSTKREARIAERKEKKEAHAKRNAEEHFERKNELLDEQIETKEKLKKILTPEQLEKWKTFKEAKKDGAKKERKHLKKVQKTSTTIKKDSEK